MLSTINRYGFAVLLTVFGLFSAIAQIPEKAEDICPLLIGETLPNASLQDAEGRTIQLKEVLEKGPTVLVFYRGGWCPYCNRQLSGLVDIENDILELGYQIVAVSPDEYQKLKNTEEKESINYKLFSDPNAEMIQEIGIAFQPPPRNKEFTVSNGQKKPSTRVLPVPTVMIVDKKGVIQFEYMNTNYKKRITGEMLLAVLQTIQK